MKRSMSIVLVCMMGYWGMILAMPNQGVETKTTQNMDQFMNECYKNRLFTGSVLVAERGKVIYKKSFGLAERRWNIFNQTNTKFKIGSLTKQFTAMMVLQLVQEGKINLQGSVSDYLGFYPKTSGKKIKIHHLLCHSGGIPNLSVYYPDWFSDKWLKEYETRDFIALFSGLPLEFEPGTRFSYSNEGYFLLGTIIEKVTGKSFETVLREKILNPLGMKASGFFDEYTVVPGLATGYEYWNFRFANTGYSSATIHKGNGGMYSTIEDLFKWDQALYTGKLLSQKYLDLMFQPQMNMRYGVDYGYGWVLRETNLPGNTRPGHLYEHFGSDLGFNNLIVRIPGPEIVIILLSNTAQADLPLIEEQLLNILSGQAFSCPQPVSLALDSCQDQEGVKNVIKDFQQNRHRFIVTQDAVNGVGFKFIRQNRKEMGVAILEFNASLFPDSPFVYESLAEAYMLTGNKQLVKQNLEKLLEIDPENRAAKARLKNLK